MFTKTILITFSSLATLSLATLPARAEIGQAAEQGAVIEGGTNNTINQTINQYIFRNPGQGAIKRKESIGGNTSDSYTNKGNKYGNSQNNYNNRDWGQNRGKKHGHNR